MRGFRGSMGIFVFKCGLKSCPLLRRSLSSGATTTPPFAHRFASWSSFFVCFHRRPAGLGVSLEAVASLPGAGPVSRSDLGGEAGSPAAPTEGSRGCPRSSQTPYDSSRGDIQYQGVSPPDPGPADERSNPTRRHVFAWPDHAP
ncbi:hypothetical protein NDU88_002892 [Pleurodeles waltl]|uniref:Uncharacterized protein n=1 Tax=Pleurodeles waltl TaxID=8319 RepID=A0AAV7KWX4_PLEWA|nr:hypothetical protein NDU88_002892 [Pleurodeles waltl]